jgi:IS30 family transposase
VERTTGYTMLLHLPDGYRPEQVRDALAAKIQTLPATLRGSLTWDQGPKMRDWKDVAVAADIDIYFCDPHAPWQRGTNENTNGLLRQYFPKSSDLSPHDEAELDRVAAELNDRPVSASGSTNPSRRSLICFWPGEDHPRSTSRARPHLHVRPHSCQTPDAAPEESRWSPPPPRSGEEERP